MVTEKMFQIIKPTPKAPNATKWIATLFGIFNSTIAIIQLFQSEVTTNWGLTQAFVLIVAGPMMFVYGVILFIESKSND